MSARILPFPKSSQRRQRPHPAPARPDRTPKLLAVVASIEQLLTQRPVVGELFLESVGGIANQLLHSNA